MTPARNQAYKEITYQQLRSFCETARLGSFSAAARSLDLAQPTVWAQVHVLERQLGDQLVEPFGQGCRLTEAGRLLLSLAASPVAGIATLKRAYEERRGHMPSRLVVGASPRIIVEDLPAVARAFTREHPNVHLSLREFYHDGICEALEAGEIDLAFMGNSLLPGEADPLLTWSACYELNVYLVTPRHHPLARRKRILLQHLRDFPLVNAPEAIHDRAINQQLQELGLFSGAARHVEVLSAAAIRNYVELGFGIGLICSLPPQADNPLLHLRDISRLLGRSAIHVVQRRVTPLSASAGYFIDTVKAQLAGKKR